MGLHSNGRDLAAYIWMYPPIISIPSGRCEYFTFFSNNLRPKQSTHDNKRLINTYRLKRSIVVTQLSLWELSSTVNSWFNCSIKFNNLIRNSIPVLSSIRYAHEWKSLENDRFYLILKPLTVKFSYAIFRAPNWIWFKRPRKPKYVQQSFRRRGMTMLSGMRWLTKQRTLQLFTT